MCVRTWPETEIENAGGGLEHKLDMFAKAYHIPHGEVIGIFLPYTSCI